MAGSDLGKTYGYAYSPDGAIVAASARASWVREAALAYVASHYRPEEQLPLKILVQFDRTSGRYGVTFEDTDVNRWEVTPANYKELREDLRPSFD